ncbi:MarR family winged helix-turn-helix transcriptional regulator [Clostridium paridis]|uniref:Winged helix-turn-helix transcriptional regulator n=1 Tax=Clostridium paridis TaxID=2803863 RepID=A0A937FGF4_9CLOT|nr:MarR family winged helix-turn-helix transcriptional regulator [Clostridium paridis]MBL4933324.1 winged helix-turn-helix transcriptional regulator [Clostridium paridis]
MSEDERKEAINTIVNFHTIFQKEVLDLFPYWVSGLSPLLSRALIEIYNSQDITPSILNKRLSITVPNTSRCLQQLSDLGYIVKIKDKADRRITHIKLTEKGLALARKSIEIMESILLEKLSVLEVGEIVKLSEAFTTIKDLLEKIGKSSPKIYEDKKAF